MHIPDGFLDNSVAAAAAVPAVAAVGYGVRRAGRSLDDRKVPLLGVTAAFIFAVQMLNFPVAGGTSGHLLGGALAAILLGPWLACIVMAVVISGQAFVFADGGVTALGANVFNMGVVGALGIGLVMVAARHVLPRTRGHVPGRGRRGRVALGDGGGPPVLRRARDLGTVPLRTVLPAMLGVHALIGIGEAVITVAAVAAVLATRPDLVDGAGFGELQPAPLPAPGAEAVS